MARSRATAELDRTPCSAWNFWGCYDEIAKSGARQGFPSNTVGQVKCQPTQSRPPKITVTLDRNLQRVSMIPAAMGRRPFGDSFFRRNTMPRGKGSRRTRDNMKGRQGSQWTIRGGNGNAHRCKGFGHIQTCPLRSPWEWRDIRLSIWMTCSDVLTFIISWRSSEIHNGLQRLVPVPT